MEHLSALKSQHHWRRSRMMHGAFSLYLLTFLLAFTGGMRTAFAAQITLRVVDQNGTPIKNSQLVVANQTVSQGGSVSLPAGTYPIRIFPGITGYLHKWLLWRDDTLHVGWSDQEIELEWKMAPLTIKVVDQNGQPIPNSQVVVSTGTYLMGSTVLLPVTEDPAASPVQGSYSNGYPLRVLPGIAGNLQVSLLWRDEAPQELTEAGLIVTKVWKTAPLTVYLTNQHRYPIPNSQVVLYGGTYPMGSTVILPVTEEPAASPVQGSYGNGYFLRVLPGIAGNLQVSLLWRDEAPQELTEAGLIVTKVWKTAPLTVELVDQNDHPIANSQIHVFAADTYPTGTMLLLPVTEDPAAPPVQGDSANGYLLRLFPAINGIGQRYALFRDEPPMELTDAGLHRTLMWEMAVSTLLLVDANANEVTGGTISHPFFTGPSGMPVSLPITDDSIYPGLSGSFRNGYPQVQLRTSSSASWAGPFTLKLLGGGTFNPAFVPTGSGSYGLNFGP